MHREATCRWPPSPTAVMAVCSARQSTALARGAKPLRPRESIGVNYKTVYRPREWSEQAIVNRLHELHAAGADLRAGSLQKADIPLSGAIQRYFGTLRRAMEAAILPYNPGPSASSGSRAPGHWTQDLVVKTLCDLHQAGHDLRYRHMKEHSQPLFYAAKQLFGSYVNAVREAGIDYWHMSQANLARERGARRQAAGPD